MIASRLDVALETSERICRGIYETWLQLILQRNQGKLTRQDVEFITTKIKTCTEARVNNIAHMLSTSGSGNPAWAVNRAQTKMQSVASSVGRELEIKLREQEAFSTPEDTAAIDVSFLAFIRAFGTNWLTKMSGPLTVPFTIAALLAPAYLKPLFALLAIISGLTASYHVWKNARLAARL